MERVLIVGCGLSGICLAHHLQARNLEVTILDNGINHSTKVAAGMINPLVFRRMTKSWRVDDFLPYAQTYYQQLEEAFNQRVFHPLIIRRFFSSEQERNFWVERQETDDFKDYMFSICQEDEEVFPEANVYGSGRVKNAGFIDTEAFLSRSKSSFQSNVTVVEKQFVYADLNPVTGDYQSVKYDLVIFAEGYRGVENPWFNYLPLTQTKGETLTISMENFETDESLNRKCFMLPLQNGLYKIGSTYSWNDATLNTTEEAKGLILDNFRYLTTEVPIIIEQHAGIRPTTLDRRPFIGRHPNYSKLAIFNGLGAKGFLIAPLLVKEFVAHLLDGEKLDLACEISNRKHNLN